MRFWHFHSFFLCIKTWLCRKNEWGYEQDLSKQFSKHPFFYRHWWEWMAAGIMKWINWKTLFSKDAFWHASSHSDVRTTTGSNPRNILLKTSLSSVDYLQPGIVKHLKYTEIKERDMLGIPIIKEAMDIRSGNIDPPDGWTGDKLEEIFHLACTE